MRLTLMIFVNICDLLLKNRNKSKKNLNNEKKEREQNEEVLIDVLENTCNRLQASGKI